ncbi:hypothetical protein K1719_010496 [Acacia pycnantha]|nr:hypothetical protein K1719_010496 [Acacia pycnantha]
MEGYSNQVSANTGSRPNFLYSFATVGGPSVGNQNHHQSSPSTYFHLQSGGSECYESVKNEANTSNNHHSQIFHYHPLISSHGGSQTPNEELESLKAKIMAHPHYSNLLEAYMNCHKVGAPPEVVAHLTAAKQEFEARQRSSVRSRETCKDPELDRFMEAYYNLLVKYGEELTRPFQDAMDFIRNIEGQLNMLCDGPVRIFPEEKGEGRADSSEEDQENSGGEAEMAGIDPRAEDRELKNHLLRKYSGCLGSLKQELSKTKKKGKLPKDARQKLLNWWELHYKWPYPSESEKLALSESTGLDQKQINNWFINQRKRHWKPSEDMQFMVMEDLHPQNPLHYMDAHYMPDPHYRLGP